MRHGTRELRKALITAGRIKNKEAAQIFEKQINRFQKIIGEILPLDSKLKAAEEPATKLLPPKATRDENIVQEGN